MLSLPPSVRLFVATQPVDGRKGADSLMVLVRNVFHHDPLSGHLFIFFSRRCDRVRVVYWERESSLAGDTAEMRRTRRLARTAPVLEEIRMWVDEQRAVTPPKTPLGRAVGYLHRQWRRLILFMDDGNIETTNNRRERELRRLVLGRKNWLFTWLDLGGKRTAAILTIVATCIAHDLNPRAYLHLVTKLIVQGWPNAKLRDLLPDRILAAHPELYAGDPDALPASMRPAVDA